MSPHRAVEPPQRPLRARALLILWPSFVMAGVLEMLVFAMVDPGAVQWPWGDAIQWSRIAIYSLAFLLFWGVIALSSAVTEYLARGEAH
ncbi:MAG TPA: hypothetical protein VLE94_08855 [Burkholderiaceae bacterium]|nr:hypothetical protein [Burkholderiaceae bacterium]